MPSLALSAWRSREMVADAVTRVAQYSANAGVGRVGVVLIKIIAEIAPDTARRRIVGRPLAGIEVRNANGCVTAHL